MLIYTYVRNHALASAKRGEVLGSLTRAASAWLEADEVYASNPYSMEAAERAGETAGAFDDETNAAVVRLLNAIHFPAPDENVDAGDLTDEAAD